MVSGANNKRLPCVYTPERMAEEWCSIFALVILRLDALSEGQRERTCPLLIDGVQWSLNGLVRNTIAKCHLTHKCFTWGLTTIPLTYFHHGYDVVNYLRNEKSFISIYDPSIAAFSAKRLNHREHVVHNANGEISFPVSGTQRSAVSERLHNYQDGWTGSNGMLER